jgi:ribosomal protein S18 acetylase RimI-like enzyme
MEQSTISVAELADAAAANLATHVSWVHQRTPGMGAAIEPDLVVVDSGLTQDTFNVACHARLDSNSAAARVADVVADFSHAARPFAWWLMPGDRPYNLAVILRSAGLQPVDSELAMVADLVGLRRIAGELPGLQIERVRTLPQLHDFAMIVASGWTPADPAVLRFYELAAPALLQAEAPLWLYVAYLDGMPVATAELTLGGGVAGLYNVITTEAYRRRGIGTALTTHVLLHARAAGLTRAVLQATEAGARVYRQLGFTTFGEITEYKPV